MTLKLNFVRLAAGLALALGLAGQAAAFGTPTQLIRAVYRPLLSGSPTATPESLLFTEDTLAAYRAWRQVQPPGLGLSPFVSGPYIIPQQGGVEAFSLPVNGRPVAFEVVAAEGSGLPSLTAAAPPVALAKFSARQIRLDALSAEVTVSFTNAGAPTELLYDLSRTMDGWRIEDVRSVGPGMAWSLRGVIGAP